MKFVQYIWASFTAFSREWRNPPHCTRYIKQFLNWKELCEVTERFQKGSSSKYRAAASARLLTVSKHLQLHLQSTPCTYLFHIISCFSTGFNIHHIQFLGFSLTLLYRNLSTVMRTNHRKEKPERRKTVHKWKKENCRKKKTSHQLKQH